MLLGRKKWFLGLSEAVLNCGVILLASVVASWWLSEGSWGRAQAEIRTTAHWNLSKPTNGIYYRS